MARCYFAAVTSWLIIVSSSCSFAAFSTVFTTSGECIFCHTTGGSALVDSEGYSLSIGDDWSSTMMANSFNDPLFRAKIESEITRNSHLTAVIEDKCLTCHTPMSRTQAVIDGAPNYALSQSVGSELAGDGVSCTLCHQIQDENLGDKKSFSGGYTIRNERKIFGPYKEVFPNPMLNHVDYLPLLGGQVGKPEFCATCHTLFTPFVDEKGNVAGEFPEQTPYLEWLNSVYALQDNYLTCQDCHMPKIDDPVKITNRPPWYRVKQSPFWRHTFIGGNRFILEIMRENREELSIITPDILLDRTTKRTEDRLRNDSASIFLVNTAIADNSRLKLDVKVENKTGHKFPTGFPSRRAWIHLVVIDGESRTIFESGNFNDQGKIISLNSVYEPHHDVIDSPGQVQIYQAIMGDVSGKRTETLLNSAQYIKDNRIPPRGFVKAGPMGEYTVITGNADSDSNFNIANNKEGTGADLVTYTVELNNAIFPLTVKGELLYQSSNPTFLDNLLRDDTPAVSRFKFMYDPAANRPVLVDSFIVQDINP